MAGFNRQQLEAIAAFERNGTPDIKAVLIVEPQFSSAALCTFNDGGRAEAYRVWAEGTSDLLTDSRLDVKSLGARVKSAVKSYYLTGKAMDGRITAELTASSYMEYYGRVGGDALSRAVGEARAYTDSIGVSNADMKFVFVGEASDFFPAEAIVRLEFLPVMPMAVSGGFKTLHDATYAIEKGEALQEAFSRKATDGRTEWSVIKDDGTVTALLLADTDTPTDSLTSPIFTRAVFTFPDDILKLNVSGKALSVAVPEGIVSDNGGLLQLALVYNEGFNLIFRCDSREAVTPITIGLKGARQ